MISREGLKGLNLNYFLSGTFMSVRNLSSVLVNQHK